MWYVIQVFTGSEEKTKANCERLIDKDILEKCFIPYYERSKKINKKWDIKREILFPGYIFVVTDRLIDLQVNLYKIPAMTKLLGMGNEIVPLNEKEVDLLRRLGGVEQIVEESTGFIVNNKVRIIAGPLIGMEGYIKKIDRHKRKCWLEVDMFGHTQKVEVGLEIVSKS